MTSLLIAFIAGFLLDFTWAHCVRSVQAARPFWAANWAALCFICGLAPPYFLVERNLWPLVAYGFGCWVGCWIATRIAVKKDDTSQ